MLCDVERTTKCPVQTGLGQNYTGTVLRLNNKGAGVHRLLFKTNLDQLRDELVKNYKDHEKPQRAYHTCEPFLCDL